MNITLYQPDIPQNAGAVFRLAACLGASVDIIEPCGFILNDARLRRVMMDYAPKAAIKRYDCWDSWVANKLPGRILLLTTSGDTPYSSFGFHKSDALLLGRESAGVPAEIHRAVDARLFIPMVEDARSLNVVTAAAMVIGEALRQTGEFNAMGINDQ